MLIILEIVLPFIFVIFTILKLMGIQAWVEERTLSFAFIEVPTRNSSKSLLVLFHQFILFRAVTIMIVWWDHQVTVLSTNRASPKVMLCRTLVVSSTPWSNTLQAENVITSVKYSELFASCQDHVHADLTFSIVPLIILINLTVVFLYSMEISALLTISAGTTGVVHAYRRLVFVLKLTLKEFLYEFIVLIILIPFLILFGSWFVSFGPCTHSLHDAQLLTSRRINYDFLTNFTFFTFVVLFKVVWIVLVIVLKARLKLILILRHSSHLHCQVLDVLNHYCWVWVILIHHILESTRVHCELL